MKKETIENKKQYKNMRIISLDGSTVYRMCGKLTATKDGKIDKDAFSRVFDESLETDKLKSVYKQRQNEMKFPYLEKKLYCRALVNLSFNYAIKEFEQQGRRYVRFGYNVSDEDVKDHICIRDIDVGSTTTALAAGSVTSGDLSKEESSIENVADMTEAEAEVLAEKLVIAEDAITAPEGVTVTVEQVTATVLKEAAAQAAEAIENITVADDMKVTAAIAAIMDLNVEFTGEEVTLTFAVPEIKAGERIIVLHKGVNGWEEIAGAVAGEGTVTATFTSFSPIAIVKVAATAEKTGVVSVLPMIAVVGLAGAAVCGKKSR